MCRNLLSIGRCSLYHGAKGYVGNFKTSGCAACLLRIHAANQGRGNSFFRVNSAALHSCCHISACRKRYTLIGSALVPADCDVFNAAAFCFRKQNSCCRTLLRSGSICFFSCHHGGNVRNQEIGNSKSIRRFVDQSRILLSFKAEGRQDMIVSFKGLDCSIGDAIAGALCNQILPFSCRSRCRIPGRIGCVLRSGSRIRIYLKILFSYGGSILGTACVVSVLALHSGCRNNCRDEGCHLFIRSLSLLRLCILIPEQIAHNGHRVHGRILYDLLSCNCKVNAGNLRRQILQVSWIGHRNHGLRSYAGEILFCFHRIEQAVHGDCLGYILAGFVTGKRGRDPDVLAGNKLREEVRKMTVLPDNAVQNDGIVFRFDRRCLLRRGSGRRDDDIKGPLAFFRKHRTAECIRLRRRARRIHFLYRLFPAGHALKRKLQLRLEALRSRLGGNRPVIVLVHDI